MTAPADSRISDYTLADLMTRLVGAMQRVDAEDMVEVPADYLREALPALTELRERRAQAVTVTDEMVERACRVHNVGWSQWHEPQKKTARQVMRSALASALAAPAAGVTVTDEMLERAEVAWRASVAPTAKLMLRAALEAALNGTKP